MAIEVRDADQEEKLRFFAQRVTEIAADLKLDGIVLIAELPSMHHTMRWPPCPGECRTKKHCAIKAYRHGADVLDRVADELEKLE